MLEADVAAGWCGDSDAPVDVAYVTPDVALLTGDWCRSSLPLDDDDSLPE